MEGNTTIVTLDFLSSSDTEVLATVKTALEAQRKEQEETEKMAQLDHLLHTLGNMAYQDIVDIYAYGKAPLAIFLLCTCFLEQMATYRYGSNKNIIRFVKQYLPKYDGEVTNEMRNRINHNYSLHEMYALTIGAPHTHLLRNRDGAIMINMENFVEELGAVFTQFSADLRNDKGMRNNAVALMQTRGILHLQTMDIVIPYSETTATSSPL